MVINMLKAVNSMLEHSDKITPEMFEVRVDCAQALLLEIIAGLEAGTAVVETGSLRKDTAKREVVPAVEGQYMVAVDADRKLKEIKGLPMDAEILLDGKKVLHKDAIGRTFTKIALQ